MEVFSSEQFKRKTTAAEELLVDDDGNLDKEEREALEILKRRGEIHRKVGAVTGGESKVFRSTAASESKVAGFNDGQSHLKEETLDDFTWALHVKRHEDIHTTSISHLDLNKYIPAKNRNILAKYLNLADINDINWIEGYTELANIQAHSKNTKCAYLKKEVPAAMDLEKLCQSHIEESLMPAFKTNNTALFYYLLIKLSDALINSTN